MAGLKIENSGNRLNINFNFGKQSSSNNLLANNTREGINRRQVDVSEEYVDDIQVPGNYAEDISSPSDQQYESETEAETDTDDQYTEPLGAKVVDFVGGTGKLLKHILFPRTGTLRKRHKVVDRKVGKGIKGCLNKIALRSKVNAISNSGKENLIKHLKSDIICPSDISAYPLGSYDEGHSDSIRQLDTEIGRYGTFLHYGGNGDQASLARDGFYHNQSDGPTSTRCIACRYTHSTWERSDNVSAIHRERSGNCSFIRRNSSSTEQQASVMDFVDLRTNVTYRPTGNRSRTDLAVNEAARSIDQAHTRTEGRINREHLADRRGIQANNDHQYGATLQSDVRDLSDERPNHRQETVHGTNSECVPSYRGMGAEQLPRRNEETFSTQTQQQQSRGNTIDDEYLDPIRRQVVAAMTEMGYKTRVAKKAVMAVRVNETGQFDGLLNAAITWTERHQNETRDEQETHPQAGTSSDARDSVAGARASSSQASITQDVAKDAASLKAENEKLKDMYICKICRDRRLEITFLPCGHLICCATCATALQECPECKAMIIGRIKSFMPF